MPIKSIRTRVNAKAFLRFFIFIPPEIILLLFAPRLGGSQRTPTDHGYYLGFHVVQRYRAEIAAVLTLCPVIAENKDAAVRDGIWVAQSLLGVGRVHYLPGLRGSVHEECAAPVDGDDVGGTAKHAACAPFALCSIDDDIVLAEVYLQPVAHQQVAVLDCREHVVPRGLRKQKGP